MSSPNDRSYLESHEWHQLHDGVVTIGISQFAVDELTDITYVEVTQDSGGIRSGESFGEIESVKATSELYAGVDGEVVEVNQDVIAKPALVNEDCYGKGWIVKIKPADPGQLDGLMSAADYDAAQGG
ncbi:MAG: glycine cleavage system protein GcvH [Rhodospirillales bacterium]|nr:glycine cleavage system protein GcvH [Rhodospirillales bacterium]